MSVRPLLHALLTSCLMEGRITPNGARAIRDESESPAVDWQPIAGAPQDGTRLMLWDSVSKRPVFGSWRGGNPAITHFAAEPAGPEASE